MVEQNYMSTLDHVALTFKVFFFGGGGIPYNCRKIAGNSKWLAEERHVVKFESQWILVEHIWSTFDFVIFHVIFRLFNVLISNYFVLGSIRFKCFAYCCRQPESNGPRTTCLQIGGVK